MWIDVPTEEIDAEYLIYCIVDSTFYNVLVYCRYVCIVQTSYWSAQVWKSPVIKIVDNTYLF
jgi:hypothetical protein